jgi:8-oxo-dGTP pyrophosphatase MutT (NUDIX family)
MSPLPGREVSPGQLLERVQPALHPLSPPPGLQPWNRDEIADLLPGQLHQAAVLLALIPRGDQLNILFTRRHDELRHHAGQVSFPGGRIEAGDSGPVAAALREAREEVGLASATPMGLLDPLVTISAFHVWPVVARVAPEFVPHPDPREVSDAFEVPLEFLLERGNCRRVEADYQGRRRHWFEFHYAGHRIWGVTAAVLVNLRERMQSST